MNTCIIIICIYIYHSSDPVLNQFFIYFFPTFAHLLKSLLHHNFNILSLSNIELINFSLYNVYTSPIPFLSISSTLTPTATLSNVLDLLSIHGRSVVQHSYKLKSVLCSYRTSTLVLVLLMDIDPKHLEYHSML